MDTRNDFTDSSFDTSLVSQISDVLALFSNDDTSFLGSDESAEGDLRCSIIFVSRGVRIVLSDNVVHGSIGVLFLQIGHNVFLLTYVL